MASPALISDTEQWKTLQMHCEPVADRVSASPMLRLAHSFLDAGARRRDSEDHLRDLMADADRWKAMTAEFEGIFLDYSRQQASGETIEKLLKLAEVAKLKEKIEKMFKGEKISMVSLAPVIRRNCKLNCLKTVGCHSLLLECDNAEHISANKYGEFLQEVGTTCCLEDVEMSWGFFPIRIQDLVPALK